MDVKRCVEDRPREGIFRAHRDAFTDPVLYEPAQKFILKRSWNFPALERQVPIPAASGGGRQ
jgi:hypothetical protein